MNKLFVSLISVLLCTSGFAQELRTDSFRLNKSAEVPHTLKALREKYVPTITQKHTLVMKTSEGDVVIELYPQAAPNAVKRFLDLTATGFYVNTPVSRVVEGFVAQFGVNWRAPHNKEKENQFDDDPSLFSLDRGTVCFAKAGPNTNSTQVFINYKKNNFLADPRYNFTVFGKVVEGMDVVDSFVQVGSPSGGLDQGRLWSRGGEYIDSLRVKPSMILDLRLQMEVPTGSEGSN